MAAKIPKPGRYIRIGKLLIPIDEPSPEPERYKIGPARRAARVVDCRNHGMPGRVGNFAKIWSMLAYTKGD